MILGDLLEFPPSQAVEPGVADVGHGEPVLVERHRDDGGSHAVAFRFVLGGLVNSLVGLLDGGLD